MQRKALVIGGILGAIGLVALFAIALVVSGREGQRPAEGKAAPDFSLPLYANYRGALGDTARLSDLRGKVVVVNFWASWCQPCRDEAPALERIYRRTRDRGLVVIGVDHLDTEASALTFLAAYGVTYPNGLDAQQKIAKGLYRITGVPETFVIDRTGVVRASYILPINERDLGAVVEKLLSE